MKAFVENRFGLLALVLIALAALYGVAFVTRPAVAPQRPVAAQRVAVESVTAVCPPPGGANVAVYTGGGVTRKTVKGGKPYIVNGAGGLEAGYTTRVTSGRERGLAGVRCAEPSATTWLIGPGPAEAALTLHLTNADKAVAFADIEVHAAEGRITPEQATGIEVKPGEHREIDLRKLAPSADVMALGVTTTSGRLAVSARATLTSGGVDWLPAAAPPATHVVVPGIPGGGGRRELLVAAPGDTDALVRIRAITEDAAYATKGRETLDVPAGAVASLDLTTGIGGQPAALEITSETPVVAGLVAAGTGEQADVAFTASTPALDLGSAVAANGKGSRLILTAPGQAGKVRVQVVPSGSRSRWPCPPAVPRA